jgi:hypothetical protein
MKLLCETRVLRKKDLRIIRAKIWETEYAIVASDNEDIY